MLETLREKIEKLSFSRILIHDALFVDFVNRDEVLALCDAHDAEQQELGVLRAMTADRQERLEKLEIPLDLVIAKEQVRTLVSISQTLGSISEEIKKLRHG